MLNLTDKDFKAAMINMFKELKENMAYVNKLAVLAENVSYKIIVMEVLKLKSTVAGIKKSYWIALTADWICQMKDSVTLNLDE